MTSSSKLCSRKLTTTTHYLLPYTKIVNVVKRERVFREERYTSYQCLKTAYKGAIEIHMYQEWHVSRRENGKWLPGNFPENFCCFDKNWPKKGKKITKI